MSCRFTMNAVIDARHEKTDLKVFIVVIPKEGWVRCTYPSFGMTPTFREYNLWSQQSQILKSRCHTKRRMGAAIILLLVWERQRPLGLFSCDAHRMVLEIFTCSSMSPAVRHSCQLGTQLWCPNVKTSRDFYTCSYNDFDLLTLWNYI